MNDVEKRNSYLNYALPEAYFVHTDWSAVDNESVMGYSDKREREYAQLNQFEMQFDDQRDGTTTWVDTINAIKSKHPKPE